MLAAALVAVTEDATVNIEVRLEAAKRLGHLSNKLFNGLRRDAHLSNSVF
jgi:hypothetical protein